MPSQRQIELHRAAYEHTKRLIREGRFVLDERDAWSEHQPGSQAENRYLNEHGAQEVRAPVPASRRQALTRPKAHDRFPYRDFSDVHHCGVLSVESRAGQYRHPQIRTRQRTLHGMLDAMRADG
jgi:hypothetical protein